MMISRPMPIFRPGDDARSLPPLPDASRCRSMSPEGLWTAAAAPPIGMMGTVLGETSSASGAQARTHKEELEEQHFRTVWKNSLGGLSLYSPTPENLDDARVADGTCDEQFQTTRPLSPLSFYVGCFQCGTCTTSCSSGSPRPT